MFARIVRATIRALLVCLLIAIPSVLLPSNTSENPEMIALLAILAGIVTFTEYNAQAPSLVEFRDAPPVNRLRFVCLLAMFLILTMMAKHGLEPDGLTQYFASFGHQVGHLMDFPYSPVRLMILMLPGDAPLATVESVRASAGVTYVVALVTVVTFLACVRLLNWPIRNGAFNVWINLPLFDPTKGSDVVHKLQRDGRINVILGFLLPFIIPAVVKLGAVVVDPITIDDPQTLIWTMSAWAFLPASIIMRGMAMLRVAELIEAKRRDVYEVEEEALQAA